MKKLFLICFFATTNLYAETYFQGGASSFRVDSGLSGNALGVDVGYSYNTRYGGIDTSIGIFDVNSKIQNTPLKWNGVMTYASLHTPAWNRITGFLGYQITQQPDNTFRHYHGIGLAAHLDPIKLSAIYATDGKNKVNMLVIKYRMELLK